MLSRNFIRPLLFMAALFFYQFAFANPAARVEFSVGNVVAESAEGAQRAVAKGEQIDAGDTISTNDGRAQLRFTDGGYVSLHERTVFRIDDYRWEGVEDRKARSLFSLLTGGLRTITGRIAKANRKAYLMSTAVATIGIRGTEYTMQLNDSLAGAVADGEIEVCNAAGCVVVAAGQGYFVKDANTRPVLSNNQAYLPPPPPGSILAPLGETTGDLLGTIGGAADGLLGLTQDLAASLLGGTILEQPVQDLTSTVGDAFSTTVDTSGGLIDSTTGTIGDVTGTDGLGNTLNLLGF
jgi:hypothetical protein